MPGPEDPLRTIDAATPPLADPGATIGGDDAAFTLDTSSTGEFRYELAEEIARGGMGIVYRAIDKSLAREVAVKVLQAGSGSSSGAAHRFADEARITGQLQHPGIPPVHELGMLPDGRQFLAMKLIKGCTFDLLLAGRPDISHDRGRYVAVFEAICQAVAYAHAHGVIHRDLKPSNVMVGSFGEVQVMDWGLAKVLGARTEPAGPEEAVDGTQVISLRDSDGSFTQAGSVLGTLAFMPPEQAVGAIGKVDQRSDVFGLGAILAVVLTGKPPFVSGSAETTRVLAAQGDLAECLARLDGSGADPDLVALCKRCLSPKAGARPQDAGDVARAVAELRAAADERARRAELDRVRAEGDKAAAEARAAERRTRRRVALFAAAALALALVGGMSAVLAVQRQANAKLAAKNEELADEQIRLEQRFALAQKAIGSFHTGISEDLLMKNDQLKDLRTRLLKEAVAFYGDLEKSLRGQTDTKSLKLLAAGYAQLGDLMDKIGESRQALTVLRKALDVRRALAAEADADFETRLDLARTLGALGSVLTLTGDSAGALEAFEEQRALARSLEETHANSNDVQAVLAQSWSSIGEALRARGKTAPAREAWRKAAAIRQKLADANPADPKYQIELARSCSDLGVQVGMSWTELEEALPYDKKGVEILKKLVDRYPTVAEYQFRLATGYKDVGWAESHFLWKPLEALVALNKSLELYQALITTYPAVNAYQSHLADLYRDFGTLMDTWGKWPLAADYFQKALTIGLKLVESNPGNVDDLASCSVYYCLVGKMLAEKGRELDTKEALQKGMKTLQQVVNANPAHVDYQQFLANYYDTVGDFLHGVGKSNEAIDACSKARTIRRKLLDAHPQDLMHQAFLADSDVRLSRLLADSGRLEEALRALQASLPDCRKIAAAAPSDPRAQNLLANELIVEGSILLRLGRTSVARAAIDEAIKVQTGAVASLPDRPGYSADLALAYLRSGEVRQAEGDKAAAVADWKRAIDLFKSIPTLRGLETFQLACCHAALAGATKQPAEAEEAMVLLKKAINMSIRSFELFRSESALDSLRNRGDFKKLVEQMETLANSPLEGGLK